ncbi:MAG TPA: hypothetical protein VNO17_09490 [Actinomycetota bacterium]|nr:hypothetical protein [Actinomycetota bacterium]
MAVDVPDGIAPVEGYRAWAVGLGRLWSPAAPVKEAWPLPGPLRARCLPRAESPLLPPPPPARPPHEAPHPGCGCGIYGMWEPWGLGAVEVPPMFAPVLGRVEGWGRVVVGRRGWRAAFARPVELYALPSWGEATARHIERLARGWGIPLRRWDAHGEGNEDAAEIRPGRRGGAPPTPSSSR